MESTAVNIFIAMDSIGRSVDFLPTSGIFGENFLLKLSLLLGPINNLDLQKNRITSPSSNDSENSRGREEEEGE